MISGLASLASSGLLGVALCFVATTAAYADDWRAEAESSARALFERNIQAIADHDAEAYLACYLHAGTLVRNGFSGVSLGFEGLASGVNVDEWPVSIEALDLQVHAVHPAVVYGQYRYRVVYSGEGAETVDEGISERVFVRTDDGWRIAVSTAFSADGGAFPPLEDGSDEGENR